MTRSLKLLEISPGDSDAKLSLAKALRAQNRIPDALALLERLLVEDPQNGAGHVLTGQIFLSQGRFVEADDHFRNASLLFEGDCHALLFLGKNIILTWFARVGAGEIPKSFRDRSI